MWLGTPPVPTVVKKRVTLFLNFSQIARAESGALFFHKRSQIEGKSGSWVIFFLDFSEIQGELGAGRFFFIHVLPLGPGNGALFFLIVLDWAHEKKYLFF